MALKDWKKIGLNKWEKENIHASKKLQRWITLRLVITPVRNNHNGSIIRWAVYKMIDDEKYLTPFYKILRDDFSSKSKALKFVKDYMKKH